MAGAAHTRLVVAARFGEPMPDADAFLAAARQRPEQAEDDSAEPPPGDLGLDAEGVAGAMALSDPWCEDAADPDLWRQCAQMHDARPADDERAAFRRKRAWFEYIRTAAERSVDQ